MPSHLIIVLPGARYGLIGPAILFPVLALEQSGGEVHLIGYPRPLPRDLNQDSAALFAVKARDLIQAEVDARSPDRVSLVAKSLGTVVLGAIGDQLRLPDRVEALWLTPLFGLPYVREGAARTAWRSLIVSGAADPAHDTAGLEQVVAALGAESLVIEAADHALQISGDVLATVEAMRCLAEAVLQFAHH